MGIFGSLRRSGLLWATPFAVLGLAILIGLGTWQLQRLSWKQELQQKIDQRASRAPVPLAQALARTKKTDDLEYTRVEVTGRFQHTLEQYYFATGPNRPGWHIYTPLRLDDGRSIIVNRGYVPMDKMHPASRAGSNPDTDVTFSGLLRSTGQKGYFTPPPNKAQRIWYARDLEGMIEAAFGPDHSQVIPYFIDADLGGQNAADAPRGGTTNTKLTNRHLEYALTWYGLALTLLGVFIAFAWSRLSAGQAD